MPPTPVATRCFVLAPNLAPGDRAASARLAALVEELTDARGWSVETADDPLVTLADVAGRERAEVDRSAWGLRRRLEQTLVVVPPEDAGGYGEVGSLIDAVRRYLPDLPAWMYAAGGLSPLTRGGRAREHTNGRTAATEPSARAARAPVPAREIRAEPEPAEPKQTTIEPDELGMLLNRDPGDMRIDVGSPSEPDTPEPPPLPSAYAAPGVELRLAEAMTPEEADRLRPADEEDGADPLALGDPDDGDDPGPGRITEDEMRMLFQPDPEAPARS